MREFTFKFSEVETNILLNALAKQPFEVVSQIINSIQSQAQEQINPKTDDTNKSNTSTSKK